MGFAAEDFDRMNVLASKAQDGALTVTEQAELESYERVGHILTILQSKARTSLRNSLLSPAP